jgi:2-dehydro-3-deoxygluconokinase
METEWARGEGRIVALGEPLIELQPDDVGGFRVSIGGDVANVMICLGRLLKGGKFHLSLSTSLGTSLYAEWLRRRLVDEGIRVTEAMIPGEPGIYGISPDLSRQPASSYWRTNSSASKLLSAVTRTQLIELVPKADILLITGITLALCSDDSFEELCLWVEGLAPSRVIFDTNYRPALWKGIEEARRRIIRMESLSTVVATSWEDEMQLHNAKDVPTALQRHLRSGREIILRGGKEGCWIAECDRWQHVPTSPHPAVNAVGAGDGHLAGYIAARLSGYSRLRAAQYANRVAGFIVCQPGSIPHPTAVLPALDVT